MWATRLSNNLLSKLMNRAKVSYHHEEPRRKLSKSLTTPAREHHSPEVEDILAGDAPDPRSLEPCTAFGCRDQEEAAVLEVAHASVLVGLKPYVTLSEMKPDSAPRLKSTGYIWAPTLDAALRQQMIKATSDSPL